MSLWILFMSQHLNPPSALVDHRGLVAWFISNGPHSVACCCKLGPNGVKAECLCPQKATTIFQHTHATTNCAWPRPPTTKHVQAGFLPSFLARFIVWALHAVQQPVPYCFILRALSDTSDSHILIHHTAMTWSRRHGQNCVVCHLCPPSQACMGSTPWLRDLVCCLTMVQSYRCPTSPSVVHTCRLGGGSRGCRTVVFPQCVL